MTAKHQVHCLEISASTKAQNEASREFYLMVFLRNSSLGKRKVAVSALEQHCGSREVLWHLCSLYMDVTFIIDAVRKKNLNT